MTLPLPFVGLFGDYTKAFWNNYIAPPPEPPMPPTWSGASIVSASSVPDVNALITEQQKAWQASNQGFMNALATQIDANEAVLSSGTNWLLVGAAAVGGLLLVKVLAGR